MSRGTIKCNCGVAIRFRNPLGGWSRLTRKLRDRNKNYWIYDAQDDPSSLSTGQRYVRGNTNLQGFSISGSCVSFTATTYIKAGVVVCGGGTNTIVKMPGSYAGKVNGLCGTIGTGKNEMFECNGCRNARASNHHVGRGWRGWKSNIPEVSEWGKF